MSNVIKNARVAFPNLFTPDAKFGKYGAQLIIEPNNPALAAIEAEIEAVAAAKWGAKAEGILKTLRATGKVCLKDGDTKAEYEGFEGNMVLSSGNTKRPTVVNRDRSPVTEDDGIVYAGCYVNAIVSIWAQDNEFGKRINASLDGMQFVKDGDSFGGGNVASASQFEDLSDGADADDMM